MRHAARNCAMQLPHIIQTPRLRALKNYNAGLPPVAGVDEPSVVHNAGPVVLRWVTRAQTLSTTCSNTHTRGKNTPSYHIYSKSIQHLEASAVKHYDAHTGQVHSSFDTLFWSDVLLRESRERRVLVHGMCCWSRTAYTHHLLEQQARVECMHTVGQRTEAQLHKFLRCCAVELRAVHFVVET